jgi:hypothetical protein
VALVTTIEEKLLQEPKARERLSKRLKEIKKSGTVKTMREGTNKEGKNQEVRKEAKETTQNKAMRRIASTLTIEVAGTIVGLDGTPGDEARNSNILRSKAVCAGRCNETTTKEEEEENQEETLDETQDTCKTCGHLTKLANQETEDSCICCDETL